MSVAVVPQSTPARHKPPERVRVNRYTQAIRFVRVSRLLLWTIWIIYRERRRVLRARERGDPDVQPNVELLIEVLIAFRKTAVELGVLMIKLGQFLSSRADLLPQRALDVLSSLQDEVPPAPFSHVVSVIEPELHQPLPQLFSVVRPPKPPPPRRSARSTKPFSRRPVRRWRSRSSDPISIAWSTWT